ncbi:MAG: hypothetical protein ACRC6S_08650 [Shewanella sp.]
MKLTLGAGHQQIVTSVWVQFGGQYTVAGMHHWFVNGFSDKTTGFCRSLSDVQGELRHGKITRV